MFSQALNRLTTIHGKHLTDVIEIINDAPTEPKALLMQRLFVVSLVAFWEAFHEELCREILACHSNPPENAEHCIETFHNPMPKKTLDYIMMSSASKISQIHGGETYCRRRA